VKNGLHDFGKEYTLPFCMATLLFCGSIGATTIPYSAPIALRVSAIP